jgi:protein-L-isoaspartate(D-aspartate) O-methyltransferase
VTVRLAKQRSVDADFEGRSGRTCPMGAGPLNEAQALVDNLAPHVADRRVLDAIANVPRHCFVPAELRPEAWENTSLRIGEGQTISQPLVVARMCELLELTGDETVLDIGTGSGYHAAVLAFLARRVVSIERHATLSEAAASSLHAAGVENVELVIGDGSAGYAPCAPYEAINVAAGTREVPAELERQLATGGRMVIPVGRGRQRLMVIRRTDGELRRDTLDRVRFVPLVVGAEPARRAPDTAPRRPDG